jgi:hypothetical protein
MTKPVSSKINRFMGGVLRQTRLSVDNSVYHRVIAETPAAVEDIQIQIKEQNDLARKSRTPR